MSKDMAGAPCKIKQNKEQKGQKCQQSVVTGRLQLYCAVQYSTVQYCAECSRDRLPFSFVRGQDSTMWDIV